MLDSVAGNAAILAHCPHFLNCGGCVDTAPKDDRLPQALLAAGYAPERVAPIAVSGPGARRRMDLAARRSASGVELGLHRHRSHEIIDLQTCLVLHPDLVALFTPLRDALSRSDLLRKTGSIIANRLDNGTDLLLRTDAAASRHDRQRLAEFAEAHNISRISHAIGSAAPETVAMLRRPVIALSGVCVPVPPGGFLQATAAGEAAIVAAVLAGLPAPRSKRDRVADLYAGCGTLSFALAARVGVDAYEGDTAAHAALDQACRDAGLAGRVNAHARDLVRQPLMPAELARYAAVVLDPPVAGAGPQIAQIIAARVARIIYVSCDPHSLARDAQALHRAGYALLQAHAIDQFIGATRVESVCVFDLGRAANRGGPRLDRG